MVKVTAKCPASCGELMQGWIAGSEKLVSYLIEWYSEVILEEQREHKFIVNNPSHSKVESSWSPRFGVLVLEPLQILITEEFVNGGVAIQVNDSSSK